LSASRRVLPMFTSPSEQIQHFHQRAIECAEKALSARSEEARSEFLALGRTWLALAHRYELSDRRDAKQRLNRWRGLEARSRTARGLGETVVPFLTGKTFRPETIAELSNAFERACLALMVLPGDPRSEQIARKLIELAQRGLRDSTQLFCTAIEELNLRD
jgi:hypothetical protein